MIEKQTIDFKDRANRDVFGYYVDSGYISFQGFFIRQGKLLERNMSITPLYEDEMDAFTSFIMQYYEKNVVPKEILVRPNACGCFKGSFKYECAYSSSW